MKEPYYNRKSPIWTDSMWVRKMAMDNLYPYQGNFMDGARAGSEMPSRTTSPMNSMPPMNSTWQMNGMMPYNQGMYQYDNYRMPEDDINEEKEMEYFRSMYPHKMERVQEYVEEQCDKMDYEGSPIYDEYPDKIALYKLARAIFDLVRADDLFMNDVQQNMNIQPSEEEMEDQDEDNFEMKQLLGPGFGRPGRRRPHHPRPPQRNWLEDVVDVLLVNEVHRRRCRRRNCRW
ncbi:MAG: hypothetical protein ACLRZ7_06955 [Lachnospiraceae bacterium]